MGTALLFPSLATWAYFMLLSGSPAMGPVYTASKVLQFSLPLVATIYLFRRRISFFKGGLRGTSTGLVFGALVAAAIVALYLCYLRQAPVFAMFGERLTEKLTGLGAATPLRFAILAVFLSLFHSLLEEYYWRWFVFGELLRRITRWAAYVIASVGFSAHHFLVVLAYFGAEQLPWVVFFSLGVAVGGAMWCWLYERYDSLFAPWISHLLVDVALLSVGAIHLWA